jgi:hypothetical protein
MKIHIKIPKPKPISYEKYARATNRNNYFIGACTTIGNWLQYSIAKPRHMTPLGMVFGIVLVLCSLAIGAEVIKRKKVTKFGIVFAVIVGAANILWIFAALYLTYGSPANFGQHLSNLDAAYFSLGIFTTAGTGTISPISEGARLMVSIQYVVDAVYVVGIVTLALARLSEYLTRE